MQKIYFSPSYFLVYRLLIPLVLKNLILVSKFISFIFQFFSMRGEGERGLLNFGFERENHYLHLFRPLK